MLHCRSFYLWPLLAIDSCLEGWRDATGDTTPSSLVPSTWPSTGSGSGGNSKAYKPRLADISCFESFLLRDRPKLTDLTLLWPGRVAANPVNPAVSKTASGIGFESLAANLTVGRRRCKGPSSLLPFCVRLLVRVVFAEDVRCIEGPSAGCWAAWKNGLENGLEKGDENGVARGADRDAM